MSITSLCITEEHCGNTQPKDAWRFGKDIQHSQSREITLTGGRHTVLFNKGRYFETSFYDKKLMNEVAKLSDCKIEFNNMIVGSWKKLEDFVIAMNISGYYVDINIDWI